MINEDRVKELYHLAVYESTSEKTHKQVNEYYMGDYVWKEVLKSFFSGTFAFVGIVCLWAMNNMDKINAWRYLSMLGNPKTHIRNLVSNVAMKGTVAVKNALMDAYREIMNIQI